VRIILWRNERPAQVQPFTLARPASFRTALLAMLRILEPLDIRAAVAVAVALAWTRVGFDATQ
jgi:hypothetical protein